MSYFVQKVTKFEHKACNRFPIVVK